MARFYFTYGAEGYPFEGGWTEIEAPDIRTACAVFRAYHPDRHRGLLNCDSICDEISFQQSTMNSPRGNRGHCCHEIITVQRKAVAVGQEEIA